MLFRQSTHKMPKTDRSSTTIKCQEQMSIAAEQYQNSRQLRTSSPAESTNAEDVVVH